MVTSFRRLHFERTHTGRRQANAWRTYMEEGVSEFDTERAEHRRDQRERLHLQALQAVAGMAAWKMSVNKLFLSFTCATDA